MIRRQAKIRWQKTRIRISYPHTDLVSRDVLIRSMIESWAFMRLHPKSFNASAFRASLAGTGDVVKCYVQPWCVLVFGGGGSEEVPVAPGWSDFWVWCDTDIFIPGPVLWLCVGDLRPVLCCHLWPGRCCELMYLSAQNILGVETRKKVKRIWVKQRVTYCIYCIIEHLTNSTNKLALCVIHVVFGFI